jgi:succinate-acetate transporter protein
MAVGNTFGATALSSYGGFWLSFAIILTPGGFAIESSLVKISEGTFLNSFGLYLMGWFIFTFLLLICTLRSTVAFFFLFFTLDMAFLMLGIGYLQHDGEGPQGDCIVAGGAFGLMAAFTAWYNALAGIADSSNRSVIALLLPTNNQIVNMCTVSSSSRSLTFPGLTRAARCVTRSTTMTHALLSKARRFYDRKDLRIALFLLLDRPALACAEARLKKSRICSDGIHMHQPRRIPLEMHPSMKMFIV